MRDPPILGAAHIDGNPTCHLATIPAGLTTPRVKPILETASTAVDQGRRRAQVFPVASMEPGGCRDRS